MTAVEYFIDELARRGVQWIATLCGHGLDPLLFAARRAGMRLVDVRNEQTAGYMADACGRLTRRPGVCAVSSGVAHANALTGVVNAHFDNAPMLLISGAGARRTAGMGHFQDLDQMAMARPVTRYAATLDFPERVGQMLDEAWSAATALPGGPVHLTFPLDVQTAEVWPESLVRPLPKAGCVAGGAQSRSSLECALETCRRPLVVAGSGAFYAGGGEAVVEFARSRAIPLMIPIWDRGVVERPEPVFMGVAGAATGGPDLLARADLVLLAGAEPDYRLGFMQPPAVSPSATVIRVDSGWERLAGVDHKPFSDWLSEAACLRDEYRAGIAAEGERQAREGTHAGHIVDALRRTLRPEDVLLIDGGSIGQWAHQLLADRYPGNWLTCGPSAVVGWGLGGAMAARLAYPDRRVVLLTGDGAFTFNVAEIERAASQGLDFVAIVADDRAWGITRAGHLKQVGEPVASALGCIDTAGLATALCARGVKAESPEAIRTELESALERRELTVIHVPIVGGNPT